MGRMPGPAGDSEDVVPEQLTWASSAHQNKAPSKADGPDWLQERQFQTLYRQITKTSSVLPCTLWPEYHHGITEALQIMKPIFWAQSS
jgi:hypothetical protein